ncbi:MAG: hypothetical protein CVT60_00340 [Actinobacteria bacterium HGW-Actinobacteria-10]|jgi:PAS domain-containing protein|nr:MAG: hypothetical protein CVT60_00340 [Actinobacteria bacterium HGW-Actinobacteria-10]
MTGIFEAIALAAYVVATCCLGYGALTAERDSRTSLWFLTAAVGLMVVVSTSNTLEHLNITAALDPYEDYAQLLFLPLLAYGLYGYLVTSQVAQIESARRAIQSEHHMLTEIVENAPIGIAIVDVGGRIGYANPVVRRLLELEDEPAIVGFTSPGKVWRAGAIQEPVGILTVDPGETFDRERYVFRTPDGEMPLLLSATPLHAEPPYGASIVTILPGAEA